MHFSTLAKRPPFDEPERLEELRLRLNAIDGVAFPGDALTRWPSFPLSVLESDSALDAFLRTMDWVFEEAAAAT